MEKTLDLVVCHCSQVRLAGALLQMFNWESRTKICPLGLLINIRPIVILYKYRSVKRYLFSNCLCSLRLEGTQSICGVTLFYWQRNNDMCYNWNMQSLATIWSIYQYINHIIDCVILEPVMSKSWWQKLQQTLLKHVIF